MQTLKLLIFSDIHNNWKALERLMSVEADYYIAAGDQVTWEKGYARCGELLEARRGKMYVLPGNHESERDIEAFCARHGFVNFHGGVLEAAGFHFAGLGYSPARSAPMSRLSSPTGAAISCTGSSRSSYSRRSARLSVACMVYMAVM